MGSVRVELGLIGFKLPHFDLLRYVSGHSISIIQFRLVLLGGVAHQNYKVTINETCVECMSLQYSSL